MSKSKSVIPLERIEGTILLIRDQKVILDASLAELYQAETRVLIQAVKRNRERFPEDFMFQLSKDELRGLKTQLGLAEKWGGRRYPPYAFTEQGVAMLSSVLQSKRAVQVNIEIMRAFVRLRQILLANDELARRLKALEGKYDKQFKIVFSAIKELMKPEQPKKRLIGFDRKP